MLEGILKNRTYICEILSILILAAVIMGILWSMPSYYVIYIAEIVKLVLIVLMFVIAISHMDYLKDNQIVHLVVGYVFIGILVMAKIYFYVYKSTTNNTWFYTTKLQWVIMLYENLLLIFAFGSEGKKYGMKIGVTIHYLLMTAGLIWACRSRGRLFGLTKDGLMAVQCQLAFVTLCVFALVAAVVKKRWKKKGILVWRYISTLFMAKCIMYAVSAVNWGSWEDKRAIVVCLMDIIVQFSILIYVYHNIYRVTWNDVSTDVILNYKQLKEDKEGKENLLMANKALYDYTKEIEEETKKFKNAIAHTEFEENKKYLDKIQNNCYRLMKLTTNIIDLEHMGGSQKTLNYEVTDMVNLVSEILETLNPHLEEKKVHVELRASKKEIYAKVDQDSIERMILNLISNAIKYNKPNEAIEVYVNERDEKVYLCVRDKGIGIPKKKMANIFKPYERVETGLARLQEGSGLGLAIVKSIVELHKGQIRIISREGRGTIIGVCLPAYTGEELLEFKTLQNKELKKKVKVELSDLLR